MLNPKQLFQGLICLIVLGCFTAKSQTNVSGGIFTSSTWTFANSPYIVVDTIVVFPGVTLTIEPGVVVKFDMNTRLEIRQAQLIAIGTATDSITFTSNSPSPTPGIYAGVYLNLPGAANISITINYCNFRYADIGIAGSSGINDSIFIKNSSFQYNIVGAGGVTQIDSCNFLNNTNVGISHSAVVTNCNVSYNQIGFDDGGFFLINNCIIDFNQTAINHLSYSKITNCHICYNQYGSSNIGHYNDISYCIIDSNTIRGIDAAVLDSLLHCEIKYNGTGVDGSYGPTIITGNDIENNVIGIKLGNSGDSIYCNKICNNTGYDLKYTATNSVTVANNYWCTPDSASTELVIYDGYDNINYGIVYFMPIDTLQCYLATGIPINSSQKTVVNIYPNPVADKLNVRTTNNEPSEIIVYDVTSRKLLQQKFTNSVTLNTVNLAKGIYFYEVRGKEGALVKKGKVVKSE